MFLIWKYFALTFSALLPLINPLGSALIFLGLVGAAPLSVYRSLARRIAINTTLFLVVIDLVGSILLRFFGISLPIVEVSGGIVIAAIGWTLLNGKDSDPNPDKTQAAAQMGATDVPGDLKQKTFYPFTFPITAGPGCIVVTLTLGAHMPQRPITQSVLAHVGFLIAIVLLSASIYFSYAYAPRIARNISPSTAHGILRVIAFILLCIGVQIAWNGMAILLQGIVRPS